MTEVFNSDLLKILELILAIGVGWIILRFLFKLARKIFAFGCFAILILGAILVISQVLRVG